MTWPANCWTRSFRISATRPACCCWKAWSATTSCPRTGPRGRCRCADRAAPRPEGPGLGGRLPEAGEILRYPVHSPYYQCMDTSTPVLDDQQEPGGRARQGVAAQARGQAAVRGVHAAPAAHRARHHAGLLRLYPAGGVPAVRRVRQRDRRRLRGPGRHVHRQRPSVQPGARHRTDPAAEHAADRALLPLLGGGVAQVPARRRTSSRSAATGAESIALPGGRVALVVGDVAGHGVRAAVTIGQLRTAIHTLAMLETAARRFAAAA